MKYSEVDGAAGITDGPYAEAELTQEKTLQGKTHSRVQLPSCCQNARTGAATLACERRGLQQAEPRSLLPQSTGGPEDRGHSARAFMQTQDNFYLL